MTLDLSSLQLLRLLHLVEDQMKKLIKDKNRNKDDLHFYHEIADLLSSAYRSSYTDEFPVEEVK